mgnify:CR=1 FL=1
MPGLSPKLPLHIDQIDGYGLTKTFKEVARQNLKMVILTNPGERIMIPNFGVGIRTYLFENATQATFNTIRKRINICLIFQLMILDFCLREMILSKQILSQVRFQIMSRYKLDIKFHQFLFLMN